MSDYAVNRIATILDRIQELHQEARDLSDEYGVPFDITLEGGRYWNTTHEYESPRWIGSNC